MQTIRAIACALLCGLGVSLLVFPFYTMNLIVKDIVPQLRPIDTCEEEDETPTDPLAGSTLDDGFTAAERDAFIRRQVESTVVVYVDNYTKKDGLTESGGTGVIIDDAGTVLTAYHVVDEAEFVQIGFQHLKRDGLTVDETRYVPMRVWKTAKSHDVALLRPVHAGEKFPPPMPVARGWVPVKDQLLWQFGKTTQWSRGRVGNVHMPALKDIAEGRVEVRLKAYYGDSGGPVVTPSGELVGIVLTIIPTTKNAAHYMPAALALQQLGYRLPEPAP